MDKKNQLDVTFCILYFSSNSCSTCFGQPCAHHLCCETNPSMDTLPTNQTCPPPCSHGTYQHKAITSRSCQLLMMGTWLPKTCRATIRREIKNTKVTSSWFFLSTLNYNAWSTTYQTFLCPLGIVSLKKVATAVLTKAF